MRVMTFEQLACLHFDTATLLIEYQTSNLNTLPTRCILGRIRIRKSSVWCSNSHTLLAVRHTLPETIIALEQNNFLRRHIFLVVEFVLVVRCHRHSFALDLVAVCGSMVVWIRKDFLTPVVDVHGVGALRI